MSMRRTTMRDEVTPMLPPRERDPYIAWRPPFPEPPFERGHTALLVVDMQYLDAHWDYSMCRKIRDAGFERELLYYKDRLDLIVPNIRRLQNAFRTAGLEVTDATGARPTSAWAILPHHSPAKPRSLTT